MNDRKRLLMQKIAEYGDHKWDVGFSQGIRSLPATDLAMGKAAKSMNQLDKMVDELVGNNTDASVDDVDAPSRDFPIKNGSESLKGVTDAPRATEKQPRRKKDELDQEMGM